MAPQPSRSIPIAITTTLLFNAKSTRARITVLFSRSFYSNACRPLLLIALLINGALQHQSVGHQLLARFYPGLDFLHVAGQLVAADDLDSPELVVRRGHVNVVPIMDMQDGARRDRRVHFHGLTAESRRHKHAEAHHAWIRHFDANFGRSEFGDP